MQSFSPADLLIHNASKSLHFFLHSGLQCIFHQASEILSTLMIWYSLPKGISVHIFSSHNSCFLWDQTSGMSLFGLFVYHKDAWLVNAGIMINSATSQFKKIIEAQRPWERSTTEQQVGLLPIYLIKNTETLTVQLLSPLLHPKFEMPTVRYGLYRQLLLSYQSYVNIRRYDWN